MVYWTAGPPETAQIASQQQTPVWQNHQMKNKFPDG